MRWNAPEADSRVYWDEWQDTVELDVKTAQNLVTLSRLLKEIEVLNLKQFLPHNWRQRERKKQYICWLFCHTFPQIYRTLCHRFKNRLEFATGMRISLLEVDIILKDKTVEYDTVRIVTPRALHYYQKSVWQGTNWQEPKSSWN